MSLVWHVRLAEQAEFDLLDIAIWTAENFGRRQAESYVETVTLALESLHDGPGILGTKARDDDIGPPISKPNPSRLGFFTSVLSPHCAGILPILRVPQAISRRPESAHRPAKFDSFLVSVLKKSARTSPAEHTQKPFRDNRLPLMHRIGFDAWTAYCNSRTR